MYVKQPWQTQAGAQEYCRKNYGGWLPAATDMAGQDCLITVAKPAFSGIYTKDAHGYFLRLAACQNFVYSVRPANLL